MRRKIQHTRSSFTGLVAGLVEVEHNGQASEEEQQEIHQEIPAVSRVVEIESDQSEDERKEIEFIVGLIVLDAIGDFGLVTQSQIIEEGNTRNPVAVAHVAKPLEIVLLSGEIPHEITQVHPFDLVAESPVDVISIGGCFTLTKSEPGLVKIRVTLVIAGVPKAGEDHLVFWCIDGNGIMTQGNVFVLAFGKFFVALFITFRRSRKYLSTQQREIAVLFAAEVAHEGHGVVHIVHVNRGIGGRADQGGKIGAVSEEHEKEAPDTEFKESPGFLFGHPESENARTLSNMKKKKKPE